MNICVVGTGYVGLVTGAVFADLGNDVVCVDNLPDKVSALEAGRMPIYEPGLEEMVARNVADRRLSFTTDLATAVRRSVIVFITVGTPPREDGRTDLTAVENVARGIAEAMERYTVIVNKSTVPVGTGEFVREVIERHQQRPVPFDVVSNPEFLKEGAAVKDFMHPDRIVIGASEPWSIEVMRALYAPFNRQHDRLIVMRVRDAEFTKYAANSMLAARISLMNEFANLAERLEVDIEAVRVGIGSDPRIGYQFIYPGPGYGGSCFPKDVQALVRTAHGVGYAPRILEATEAVNEAQKQVMFQQ